MEDKKYPIYEFRARYARQVTDKEMNESYERWARKYPKWVEGLPSGQMWDGTSHNFMYREEKSQRECDLLAIENWQRLLNRPVSMSEKTILTSELEPRIASMTFELVEHESWVLIWFSHATFDEGQTDAEFLASFDRFVGRRAGIRKDNGDDKYCLMGAEDRWRWHGYTNDSPPPCRCEQCKAEGMVHIFH